jgi:hypothetical protein
MFQNRCRCDLLGNRSVGTSCYPHLIDKVRLLAQGQLPQAYAAHVSKPGSHWMGDSCPLLD